MKTIIRSFFTAALALAALFVTGSAKAEELAFDTFLTATYQDTGWECSSINELASWSFAGKLGGNYITSGDGAVGCFAIMQGDGLTFELQVADRETKGVLVMLKIENGTVWVKGIAAAYCAAGTAVGGHQMFSDAAGNKTSGTSNGTFVENASGEGYGVAKIVATPPATTTYTFANTGCGADSTNGQGDYTPQTFKIPTSCGLPEGTELKIKSITFAQQTGSAYPWNKSAEFITLNGVQSDSRNGNSQTLVAWSLGNKLEYQFSEEVIVKVGTSYNMATVQGNGSYEKIRARLFKTTAEEWGYIQLNASMDQWRPAYQIVAEKVERVQPTPVVSWNHDFNHSKKGYTVSLGNNAALADDKGVTLTRQTSGTGGTGVAIDWAPETFSSHTMTVLVKYSGFSQSEGEGANTALLATYWGEQDKAKEILLDKTSTQVKLAYNVTSSNSGNNNTVWSRTSIPQSGLLRVQYTSEGTHFTFLNGSEGSWTKVSDLDIDCNNVADLKKDAQFYGLKIGGTIALINHYHRPSMKVEAVAIFGETLTDDVLTAYEFPAGYPASMMYSNPLATDDATVPAATYGDIVVPGNGYKATAYASNTDFTDSAVAGTWTGSLKINTHTWSAWYKIDALPASGYKPIYADRTATDGDYGGYVLSVGADGKLKVGRCKGSLQFNDGVEFSANIAGGAWNYITVVMSENNGTITPSVYVNGVALEKSSGTTFAAGMNGSRYSKFTLCAGVSAAGLYIDTTAVTDAATIKSWATNQNLVETAIPKATATLPQDGFTGAWSTIKWDNDIEPTEDIMAEITITGSDTVTIMQWDENDVITANGIMFKGTGGVKLWLADPTSVKCDCGKITSEIPLTLQSMSAVDADSTSDLTYEYSGSNEATPVVACSGVLSLGGSRGSMLKAQTSVAPSHVVFANDATLTMNVASAATIVGIEGTGKFIKTGSAQLTVSNKASGYAVDGTTIQVDAGRVFFGGGAKGVDNTTDPIIKNTTFILNADGLPQPGGWYNLHGTITFESNGNYTVLSGKNVRTYDNLTFIKRGTGTITFGATGLGAGDGVESITVEGGRLAFSTLDVINSTTLALDFSAFDKGATPINGNFKLATNTSYKFPSTLGENEEFQLCTGTLSEAANHIQEITVGDKTADALLVFNGNKVKYVWTVEAAATISESTDWSKIPWSEDIAGSVAGDLTLTIEGEDITITLDETFKSARLNIIGNVTFVVADSVYEDGCWEKKLLDATLFSATGTITLGAIKEGFYGAFTQTANGVSLRAQNKEVISINIAGGKAGGSGEVSEAANLVTGNGFYGIAPTLGDSWNNINRRWQDGGNQTITIDGPNAYDGATVIERPTMSLSATGKNTWNCDSITNPFLRGYLDDGNGVTVVVHGVPYSEYDVIVYATSDDASIALAPITINGKQYTFKDGETEEGSDVWGVGTYATPEIGKNALRINGCDSDTLTINATRVRSPRDGRATLCAVQVINKGELLLKEEFAATITESTKFSEITTWDKTFKEGQLNEATITVGEGEGEVEIEFDKPDMRLAKLTIVSERPIKFKATAALPNVPQFIIDGCTGYITYAWPVTELKTVTGGVAYSANNGSADTAIPLNFAVNNGSMTLKDATFYIGTTFDLAGTQSTVNMENATVYAKGDMGFGIGQASFNLSGTTKLTSERVVLSQGADNRTANLTLSDSAEIVVTGSTIADSNASSIMFGHWNGPSTFTLNGNAKFTAENAQVLVGKTGNNQTININGGVFTSKGIKASAGASGTNALNLNGGELKIGEYGISSYGSTTIPVTVNGEAKITSTAAMPIMQVITVNTDKALTFDATNGDITISTAVVNNGTINVVGGNVIFKPGTFNGTITTEGTGKAIYGYTVNVNNCGKLAIPAGKSADTIRAFDAGGNALTTTASDANYIYFDWEVTGGACWWDYEFDGNGNNTGTEGTALSWDDDRPFKGNEYVDGKALHVPTRPWRDVSSWPATASFVMYGTMPSNDNRYYVVFGSSTHGSNNTIFLATDNVSEDKVVLCKANGQSANNVKNLCTMTVPNAQVANHLYAFVLKSDDTQTIIDIYLDGELLQSYPFGEKINLGTGFQIASPHGGEVGGYSRPANDDAATLDWLRVYNVELSKEALELYATKYPYVSPNGSYQRTVTADGNWSATEAWTKEGTEPAEMADAPAAGATAKLAIDNDGATTTVGINLAENVTYEAIQINGDDVKFVRAEGDGFGGIVKSTGRVTANANITFAYDAFSMEGAPLTVKQGKTVTFDLSMVDMTQYFSTQTYDLTGYLTLEEGANVAFITPTELHGREATATIDPITKHYILTVTTPNYPFVYENGVWTWGTQVVTEEIMNANPTFVRSIKSNLTTAIGTYKFSVEDGATLTASSIANSGLVTVNEGGTFDVNGIDNVAVPTILNGGTLANSGSATAYDHIGTFDVTFTKDSFVNVTTTLHSLGSQWNAFNYNLNGHKLTKTGVGEYMIATGTFVGGGTIDVQEGTFTMDAGTIPANTLLTINVANNATLKFSNGKSKGFTKNGRINLKLGEGASFTNDQGIGFDELAGTGTFVATGVTAFSDMIDFKGKIVFDLSGLEPLSELTLITAPTDTDFLLDGITFALAEGCEDDWTLKVSADKVVAASTIKLIEVDGKSYPTMEEAFDVVSNGSILKVLDTTRLVYDTNTQEFTLDGNPVTVPEGFMFMPGEGGTIVAYLPPGTIPLRISEICPKPDDLDPNGVESSWVELVNDNTFGYIDLGEYELQRFNRGKKVKAGKFANLVSRRLGAGERIVVYMTEGYTDGDDLAFAKGLVAEDEVKEVNGIMIVPAKINPKKYPLVRLLKGRTVVDSVIVPSDLPDGKSVIVGHSTDGATQRWVAEPTKGAVNPETEGLTAIGPNVGPLYGVDHKLSDNDPVAYAESGADYPVTFDVNPVDAKNDSDAITSVTLIYRTDINNDDSTTFGTVDMVKGEEPDEFHGDRWTASIPASALPAAGMLVQWKAEITDAAGNKWISPSFMNKDDGYEWYGTIVRPDEETQLSGSLDTMHLFATTVAKGGTGDRFIVADAPGNGSGNRIMNIDYDALMTENGHADQKAAYPYGARVNIFDSSTMRYYDYVRIDLRGNTSAGFKKKSHGLRFAKANPLKIAAKDGFNGINVSEIRKTSFISEMCDPSRLRQMTSFWLFNNEKSPAPFDYPVRLNLNGQFYQIGFHSERFSDDLIEKSYGLNKFVYSYKNIGTFQPGSGTSAGGIEKKTPDDGNETGPEALKELEAFRQSISAAGEVAASKDGSIDTGLENAALTKTVVESFDLPSWLNYLAIARITHENDDVWANISGYWDSPWTKDGVRGTGTWHPLVYDTNLSFGQWYFQDDSARGHVGLLANADDFKSHPFYGGCRVRAYKSNGTAAGNSNYAVESIYQHEKFRRLYLRRLRTLMDKYLADTSEATNPIAVKMREFLTYMGCDVANEQDGADCVKELQVWGHVNPDSASGCGAVNVWTSDTEPQTLVAGYKEIWNSYIVPRRTHLFETHAAANHTADQIGYANNLCAGIPAAQSELAALIGAEGSPNFTVRYDATIKAVIIKNKNNETVDMSGWTLEGPIAWTLPAGTVIDQAIDGVPGEVYVTADRRFTIGAMGEITDQVVVGNGKVGTGALVLKSGETIVAQEAEPTVNFDDDTETPVATGVSVPADWLRENVLELRKVDVTDPAEGPTVNAAIKKLGRNGFRIWESWTLGLEPKVETSKPYLVGVQNNEADKVAFEFGGIEVQTGDKVPTVKYAVEYADALGESATWTPSGDPSTTPSISVGLPTTESGKKVRYYRPKFSFGN